MNAPAPLFSPAALRRATDLGLAMGRPNLDVFAEILTELAGTDRNVLAVTSDSRGSGKLKPFGKAFPRQIVEVGIAEQNLVGIAAGLASCGKTVFAVSPACFVTARSLEQIKNDVAYSNNPVVVIGISAGVSYGALGSTHHSLHDFAALRAVPNIDIAAPADNWETAGAIRLAARNRRPAYLRFGKAAVLHLPHTGAAYDASRARVLRTGDDLAFIATGETVAHALLAAAELEATDGIKARVLSLPSLRPFDKASVESAARECGAIVTVEEHLVHGGLGEACAAAIGEAGFGCAFRIVGIPDEDTVTGSQADIFRHYDITMEGLAATGRDLLRRKKTANLSRR